MSDRKLALAIAAEALQDRLAEFRDEWFDAFALTVLYQCDQPIGTVFTHGPELHVAILPKYRRRWLSRRLLRAVINPLIITYGTCETKVMQHNQLGKQFVARLGFEQISSDDTVARYQRRNVL